MITLSAIISGLLLAALGYQVLQIWVLRRSSRDAPSGPVTGLEALIGADAEVVEPFDPTGPKSQRLGRVRVGSELWNAELVAAASREAAVGDHLRVVGAAGMLLKVV
jgi:membrane protein implicated in regulation of membrane protease activity